MHYQLREDSRSGWIAEKWEHLESETVTNHMETAAIMMAQRGMRLGYLVEIDDQGEEKRIWKLDLDRIAQAGAFAVSESNGTLRGIRQVFPDTE